MYANVLPLHHVNLVIRTQISPAFLLLVLLLLLLLLLRLLLISFDFRRNCITLDFRIHFHIVTHRQPPCSHQSQSSPLSSAVAATKPFRLIIYVYQIYIQPEITCVELAEIDKNEPNLLLSIYGIHGFGAAVDKKSSMSMRKWSACGYWLFCKHTPIDTHRLI